LFNDLIIMCYHLPTAGIVILDNIFIASAYFRFHPKAKIIQVWHSAGVFKKFGLHSCVDKKLKILQRRANQNLTHVVADSYRYVDIIAEAFGVTPEIVLPIGSPRTDFLFSPERIRLAANEFDRHFHSYRHKKKILYAPTFREVELSRKNGINSLNVDLKLLQQHLGQDYILLIRLHPRVNVDLELNDMFKDFVIDVSNYANLEHLLAGTDILITDYSSIFMEYVALMKPVIFYAYDLEKYQSDDRGFYFDYVRWVPGPIVHNSDELIDAIKSATVDFTRLESFVNQLFDYRDGLATSRLVTHILKRQEKF